MGKRAFPKTSARDFCPYLTEKDYVMWLPLLEEKQRNKLLAFQLGTKKFLCFASKKI